MSFRKSLGITILVLSLILTGSIMASAKDSHSVLLNHDATVGASHLASGSYDIKWVSHSPEATVTFMRGSKVVATVEGKVEDRGKAFHDNQIVYNEAANGQRTIKEIRFRGLSEVIVFNE